MMEKITVIGPGTMGTGIAQAFLAAGFQVVLIGRSKESLQKGLAIIKSRMDKAREKGKLTQEEMDSALNNLKLSISYDDGKGSSAVIEAVSEIADTKKAVFKLAEEHIGNAILATNTSSIPINELSEAVKDKSRFIGMHFFNPVPVMKPVEVIVGSSTSKNTEQIAIQLISKCDKLPLPKIPIWYRKARAGPFIISIPFKTEASIIRRSACMRLVVIVQFHPILVLLVNYIVIRSTVYIHPCSYGYVLPYYIKIASVIVRTIYKDKIPSAF